MKSIHFNDKAISVDPRDLMDFTSSIFRDSTVSKSSTIFVNKGVIEPYEENPLMVTTTISFQTFKKDKSGKMIGTSHEWKSFRAKSFTCSNISIRQIN